MLPQTKLREIVLQFLYSWEIKEFDGGNLVPLIMEMVQVSKTNVTLGQGRGEKILGQISSIDVKIQSASSDYQIDRITMVDHLILRMMIYELLFESLPVEIAISEGIRLSNKFSTPGASSYVHAIIDAVNKSEKNCDQVLI